MADVELQRAFNYLKAHPDDIQAWYRAWVEATRTGRKLYIIPTGTDYATRAYLNRNKPHEVVAVDASSKFNDISIRNETKQLVITIPGGISSIEYRLQLGESAVGSTVASILDGLSVTNAVESLLEADDTLRRLERGGLLTNLHRNISDMGAWQKTIQTLNRYGAELVVTIDPPLWRQLTPLQTRRFIVTNVSMGQHPGITDRRQVPMMTFILDRPPRRDTTVSHIWPLEWIVTEPSSGVVRTITLEIRRP